MAAYIIARQGLGYQSLIEPCCEVTPGAMPPGYIMAEAKCLYTDALRPADCCMVPNLRPAILQQPLHSAHRQQPGLPCLKRLWEVPFWNSSHSALPISLPLNSDKPERLTGLPMIALGSFVSARPQA